MVSKKKKKNTRFYWLGLIFVVLIIPIIFLSKKSTNTEIVKFKVHRNWTADSLNINVRNQLGISLPFGISQWSKLLGYSKVRPCIFLVDPNTSVFSLINSLRKNRKQTIDLVIKAGIYDRSFSKLVSSKMDIEEEDMFQLLNESVLLKQFGVDKETWPTIVIPNTYNVSVGLDAEGLMKRLYQESELFWNPKRMNLLKKHGSSKNSVVTIASIVCKESNKVEEYRRIAGVYMNRLFKGMKLQADPTVNFAKGEETRVRSTDFDSPYNTYKVFGLPPGPICIPSVEAIDAVLDYEVHDYLYFCAKSDFSGTHIFEKDYAKHKINAKKFITALNREERIAAKNKRK